VNDHLHPVMAAALAPFASPKDNPAPAAKVSEGTASARRINAAPIPRCDFGGICNRAHGAQCAELCRRMRGEA
jgi:hypothetical protein